MEPILGINIEIAGFLSLSLYQQGLLEGKDTVCISYSFPRTVTSVTWGLSTESGSSGTFLLSIERDSLFLLLSFCVELHGCPN